MGDVIELFGSQVRSNGWTEQEKAELYRAASLLGARGLPFDTESGVSDDGDPWFLFIGRGTGEVLVHFARIDGTFVVHHSAADVVFRADDIRDLVDRVLLSPDRVAGRATGDALHSHLAATVAALALSVASLEHFAQALDEPVGDGDAPPEPPQAAGDAAWEIVGEGAADADAVAGGDGGTGDPLGADTVPAAPDVQSVVVPEAAPAAIPAGDPDADSLVPPPLASADGEAGDTTLPSAPVESRYDGIVVHAASADDVLIGTDRNDLLSGGAGDDLVLAGKGDDVIFAEDGNDIVYAGRGDDTVDAGRGSDAVYAGGGDDVVLGDRGHDTIFGGTGDDLLSGGPGDDLLYGGKGNDTLQGVTGSDTLSGDDGDDLLIATDGDAVMLGGAGTNVFHFAPGEATAWSGAGRDIFVYEEGERTDVVIHDFDPDHDVLIYLDGRGRAVDLALPPPDAHGEIDIAPAQGGSLRILLATQDDLLT